MASTPLSYRCLEGEAVIAFYETATELVREMCYAVREQQLEKFARLEAQYADHIAILHTVKIVDLDDELRKRKAVLVMKILAYDREIKELTQPWMARLEAIARNPACCGGRVR